MKIMPHGWMQKEPTMGRPKARLCALMALLWSPLAVIGATLLWTTRGSVEHLKLSAQEPGVILLAWGMVLLQLCWLALAILFRTCERPRPLPKLLNWANTPPVIHIHSP